MRLRFVNGAGNTFYDVRIPGLKMTVVQADGVDIEPVSVDEFRFGPGETYDVIVEPKDEAYTIFAQSMDRTGYACGTLAMREGVSAAVPELDPAEWLTMADMMGAMGGGMSGGSTVSYTHLDVYKRQPTYGSSSTRQVFTRASALDDRATSEILATRADMFWPLGP